MDDETTLMTNPISPELAAEDRRYWARVEALNRATEYEAGRLASAEVIEVARKFADFLMGKDAA